MKTPKHRNNIFVIIRHDFSGTDTVCCSCGDTVKADELVGEYTQLFLDKGFKPEEHYFYAVACPFYAR